MAPSTPFVDRGTGDLNTNQILVEAIPLAKLVGFFVAIAVVPFALSFLAGPSLLGVLFGLVGQFVLAVGAGIVLLYVFVRANQIADE